VKRLFIPHVSLDLSLLTRCFCVGDVPTQDEFLANLATAAKSLQKALPEVLDAVVGKTCVDL